MLDPDNWTEATTFRPTQKGWYAVLHCYDQDEGYIAVEPVQYPDDFYIDGAFDPLGYPASAVYRIPFSSEKQAYDFAQENDG